MLYYYFWLGKDAEALGFVVNVFQGNSNSDFS